MNDENDPIFVFNDLLYLSDEEITIVMKDVDNCTLLLACQNVDLELICRITSTFSKTAREYFYDDINRFQNSSLKDVEAARIRIQETMDNLYYDGLIVTTAIKVSA